MGSHIVYKTYVFNYIYFSQHKNKLTTIIFIVYSYMFRLTRVIFRLELYLFAMSLCSVRIFTFPQLPLSFRPYPILASHQFTYLQNQNEHSDIANRYSSSLKMTHVSRNM